MNIIIVGCGKIGFTLAQMLVKDGHDITVIDNKSEVVRRVNDTLDVLAIRGNGGNMKTLMEANVEECDVIIAVTGNDELNMVCATSAKQQGAKYAIARIRSPEYTDSMNLMQKTLNIDQVINPERSTALEISRLMRFPFAINIESFAHGRVEMVEFRAESGDPVIDIPLAQLHSRYPHIQFTAVQRGEEAFVADGGTVLQAGDRVYASGDRASITAFFRNMGKDTGKLRDALVIGGGHIAYYLTRAVAGMGVHITIIELNEKRCGELIEMVDEESNTVVHGDGTDMELLETENIAHCGAFICLTNRDEENLITAMLGVKRGAKKVIAKVNHTNAMDVVDNLGLDCVVSPKLTTANFILRSVRALQESRNSVVEKIYPMLGGRISAYEFTALEGAPYLNIPLSHLNIRKGVLVAVLVRDRQNIIPFGADHIEAGDTVLLIAKADSIVNLDDAFDRTEMRR